MEPPEQNCAQPSVWMVMVGYNCIEDTLAAFESLQRSTYGNLHPIFVDNGSSDDSYKIVQEKVPNTDIIWIKDNIGFARANNIGIQHAMKRGADYVFMINNDVEAAPDMVTRLVDAAEASDSVGLAVPKIYYYDEPRIIWSAGCRYRKFPPIIKLNDTEGEDDGRFDEMLQVDFITTCAVLIKRSVIEEIGLLDPNCFLYWEDYDLSVRARKAGFTLHHVPGAHLWHKVSRTTQKGKPNPGVWRIRGRSKAVFCRMHPQYRAICFPGYPLLASLGFLLSGKSSIISAFCAGYKEGKTGPLKPLPTWTDELSDSGEVILTV
ncbi:MAG: glycosyltransferase family 2 protein [Verrucomicrobiota bacterium]